jgi:hypothetical protein
MCQIEGAEPWNAFWDNHRTARKEHICTECGRTIGKGERYYNARGFIDRRFDQYYTCRHCDAASQWLVKVCRGYLFSGVLEELVEHFEEEPYPISTIGLGRLIVRMRAKWRDRNGKLVEEPTWAAELGHETFMQLREIELIGAFDRQLRRRRLAA